MYVGFVVGEVVLGLIFLPVLRGFAVSIVPPLHHIQSCVIWGMDNGPVSTTFSQRLSHPSVTKMMMVLLCNVVRCAIVRPATGMDKFLSRRSSPCLHCHQM